MSADTRKPIALSTIPASYPATLTADPGVPLVALMATVDGQTLCVGVLHESFASAILDALREGGRMLFSTPLDGAA